MCIKHYLFSAAAISTLLTVYDAAVNQFLAFGLYRVVRFWKRYGRHKQIIFFFGCSNLFNTCKGTSLYFNSYFVLRAFVTFHHQNLIWLKQDNVVALCALPFEWELNNSTLRQQINVWPPEFFWCVMARSVT